MRLEKSTPARKALFEILTPAKWINTIEEEHACINITLNVQTTPMQTTIEVLMQLTTESTMEKNSERHNGGNPLNMYMMMMDNLLRTCSCNRVTHVDIAIFMKNDFF